MSQQADGAVAVSLGDLVSRQEVSLVFKLTFPQGSKGRSARALFSVSDGGRVRRAMDGDVVWTFDDHAANDAQRRNVVVDREVAKLYAASAMAEALELNRVRHFSQATAVLEKTAARIDEYANGDPELLATIDSLRRRRPAYATPMAPAAVKQDHFAALNIAAMRSPAGKAPRRPQR